METIIIIAVLVVLYLVFGSSSKGKLGGSRETRAKTSDYRPLSEKEIQSEAEAIVEKITTPAGVTRLEERMEKASERVYEIEEGAPSSYNKALQKFQILETAFRLAEEKPLKYVFIPDSDLFESKAVLKEGYKVINLEKKKEIEKNFPNKGFFEELTYYEMEDDNPVEAMVSKEQIEANTAAIKLRTIVEGQAKHATKVKNINKWVEESSIASYNDEIHWWYDTEDLEEGITPGDAFFIEELRQMGCPKIKELYVKGYKEPKNYLSLDIEEFRNLNGVGEKTVERMRVFQGKVRSQFQEETTQRTE